MLVELLELVIFDGIVYQAGDTLDAYPVYGEEMCLCGVASDPAGHIPTGERDPDRLARIGIFVDRRRS